MGKCRSMHNTVHTAEGREIVDDPKKTETRGKMEMTGRGHPTHRHNPTVSWAGGIGVPIFHSFLNFLQLFPFLPRRCNESQSDYSLNNSQAKFAVSGNVLCFFSGSAWHNFDLERFLILQQIFSATKLSPNFALEFIGEQKSHIWNEPKNCKTRVFEFLVGKSLIHTHQCCITRNVQQEVNSPLPCTLNSFLQLATI